LGRLRRAGFPFRDVFRLLILTGARLGEVSEMRWAEIDLAAKIWTIPKERSKNGLAHAVALSVLAIAILDNLPRIESESGFVFTTNGRTPVSGFSRAKMRLDALIGDMPPWVTHDTRRSFASGAAKLGIALPVIERCLNHVSGSFAGIVGVYQRHSFADEKRNAMTAWSKHVEELLSGAAVI
jgi:integrase